MSYADWRRPARQATGQPRAHPPARLVVAGIGPIVLLAKFAVTPTQDILRTPLAVFPHGVAWQNLGAAWNDVKVSHYFANTVIVAAGSWVTGRSSSRPPAATCCRCCARAMPACCTAPCSATLFVPAVVLLVPLST